MKSTSTTRIELSVRLEPMVLSKHWLSPPSTHAHSSRLRDSRMNNVVETEYRLETNATVTIAGNVGNVQNIGPTQYGERWVINFLGASGTANAKLQVMRGNSFSPARQLEIGRASCRE